MITSQREGRSELPAREVDVRARPGDLIGDPRERFLTVDEHLEPATLARRRIACSPAAARNIEYLCPADPSQSPRVMRHDAAGDNPAE
jgi:hypothetical protein